MKICVANEILFIVPLKPVWLQTNVTPTNSIIKKEKKISITVKFQMRPQAKPNSAPPLPPSPATPRPSSSPVLELCWESPTDSVGFIAGSLQGVKPLQGLGGVLWCRKRADVTWCTVRFPEVLPPRPALHVPHHGKAPWLGPVPTFTSGQAPDWKEVTLGDFTELSHQRPSTLEPRPT